MEEFERYDPFTGMTILEKSKLVKFLEENAENGHFSKQEITEVVECAVKERASFGGFVLTLQDDGELLGVAVINRTGMENVDIQNRLSLLAIAPPHRQNGVAKKLISHAIERAGSGLALQLEPSHGEVAFFEKLGFEKKYVVMRSAG